MRNVERQAKALKLAMETASDIQANPTWDYAHLVASIQAAILDMDAEVAAPLVDRTLHSLPPFTPAKALDEDHDMVVYGGESKSLSVTSGNCMVNYAIKGNSMVFVKLREYLIEGLSLERFDVTTTPTCLQVRFSEPDNALFPIHERNAGIDYLEGSSAKDVAIDFFSHAFKNSPNKAFVQ